jgi:hypothetical protein
MPTSHRSIVYLKLDNPASEDMGQDRPKAAMPGISPEDSITISMPSIIENDGVTMTMEALYRHLDQVQAHVVRIRDNNLCRSSVKGSPDGCVHFLGHHFSGPGIFSSAR